MGTASTSPTPPLSFPPLLEPTPNDAPVCRKVEGGWIEPAPLTVEPKACFAATGEVISVAEFMRNGSAANSSSTGAAKAPSNESAPDDILTCPVDMLPCPPRYKEADPVPNGWKPYHGNSPVFHCGFSGILQDCDPSEAQLQNECIYDDAGYLLDENSFDSGCRGTPNEYDSDKHPIKHTFVDDGGIVKSGPKAFGASRIHDATTIFGWYQYLVYRSIR